MKYDQNETMKMLGCQCIMLLFERNDVKEQYEEVFKVIEKESPLMDMFQCIDLFMLGYI